MITLREERREPPVFARPSGSGGGGPGGGSVHAALFALFLGGILAYGATFAWYVLDRFDLVNLIRDISFDDSFYYFQIAWHMAEGEFSTFDGGLTRTNGYHPLWLFLIMPFYWVFDKTEALFAIKAFEIMLVAGGVTLVAGAARVARLPWILLFAALPALYRNTALFSGVESAAALFTLGLFLLTICLYARDSARQRWPLAAVAFALPWVRLEYVAISTAATGALCLLEYSWRDRAPLGERLRSMLSVGAGVPFLAAVTSLLVYFAYNGAVFGGIVPVSGATKQFLSQSIWEQEGGYGLTENAHEYLRMDAFDDKLLVALEVCVYVVLVWWFSRRSRSREDRLLLVFLIGVFGLAAAHLAKFVQSVLVMHPTLGNFPWYFIPKYLMEAIIVPARCYVAIWFIRRFIGRDPHRSGALHVSSLAIVMIGAVFLFTKADFAAPFRSVDWSRDTTRHDWEVLSLLGTMVMNRVLPEDSVVGSWDSGAVGYFSRFPVMNLDGLANSWDYLRAQKEGSAGAFRLRHGITALANVVDSAHQQRLPDTVLFEGALFLDEEDEKRKRFKLWFPDRLRESWDGVDRSAWFRERMEPHLEHQADGAGLLVGGRLAQAFVRDCKADELAVWTSGSGRKKAVLRFWIRTSLGFCTSAVVLPHDDLPPVRVATMTAGEYREYLVGERRPAIRSDFDVYLVENRLFYVKEPCGREHVAAPFFLHVNPSVPDDLPDHRRRHGFDNLDFRFGGQQRGGPGTRIGETCLKEVLLPEYDIAAIRTGQYVVTEDGFHHIWEGDIRFE